MAKRSLLKLVLVLTLVSFPMAAFAAPGDAPNVTTISSSTSGGQIILLGKSTSEGVSEYGFEFGETQNYGSHLVSDKVLGSEATIKAELGTAGSGPGQFCSCGSGSMGGVAFDTLGRTYIADVYNSRVQVFEANGSFSHIVGSNDSEQGQTTVPNDIAIDSSDNLYVSDISNHRIAKFNVNGEFIEHIGGWSDDESGTKGPQSIEIDSDDNIYILSNYDNVIKVKKFNSEGEFISSFGTYGYGEGELSNSQTLVVDPEGNIYVGVHDSVSKVSKFTNSGEYLHSVSFNNMGSTFGIDVDNVGNLYVYSPGDPNSIHRFDPSGTSTGTIPAGVSNAAGSYGSVKTFAVNKSTNDFYIQSNYSNLIVVAAPDVVEPLYTMKITDPLNCATTYHYRAFATNSNGTSYGEDSTFETPSCGAVTGDLAISSHTARTANFTWDFDSSQYSYWKIGVKPTDSNEWTIYSQNHNSNDAFQNGLGYVPGLEPNTEYVARVVQVSNNALLSGWSDPLIFTTSTAQDYEITSCEELQSIGWNPRTNQLGDLEGNYTLGSDIDCSISSTWTYDLSAYDFDGMEIEAKGFLPIADFPGFSEAGLRLEDVAPDSFLGTLDGQGHTITGLYQHGFTFMMGLFGATYGAEISNLTIDDFNIELTKTVGAVGGLTAFAVETTVDNVVVNGDIISVEPEGPQKYETNSVDGIFASSDGLYIHEDKNVIFVDTAGTPVRTYSNLDIPDYANGAPTFFADDDRNLYVKAYTEHAIIKYDENGNEVLKFANNGSQQISGFDIHNNLVYVSYSYSDVIERYSLDGTLVDTITLTGTPDGSNTVTGITVSGTGSIYINLYSEVRHYSATGEYLSITASTSMAAESGGYSNIRNLESDSDGTVYVLDSDLRKIFKYGPNDQFLGTVTFGEEISYSNALSPNADGSFYVSSSDKVFLVDESGAIVENITESSFSGIFAGGLIGAAYTETLTPSTITRTVTNVNFDLETSAASEMVFISGIGGYGTLDISDSYVTGSIITHSLGEETMNAIGGFSAYNMGGSIKRSYFSGDIAVTGTGMAMVGGIASYSYGILIEDTFMAGTANVDGPMGMIGGIGMYLMSGDWGNGIILTSSLENNFVDQTSSGAQMCAFLAGTNEEPLEITESQCSYVNSDGSQNDYFTNTSSVAPLDSWNFTDVWQTNEDALPTLRVGTESGGGSNTTTTTTTVPSNTTPVTTAPVTTAVSTPPPSGENNSTETPPSNATVRSSNSLKKILNQDADDSSATPPVDVEGVTTETDDPQANAADLFKNFSKDDVKGTAAAAINSSDSGHEPMKPMLVFVTSLMTITVAFACSKWYLKMKKKPAFDVETPSSFQGWK